MSACLSFTRLTWVNRSEAKRLMGAGGLAGRTYSCWPASIYGLVEVQNKAQKMFKVDEVMNVNLAGLES